MSLRSNWPSGRLLQYEALAILSRNPLTLIGIAGSLLLVLLAIFGPSIAPHDPMTSDPTAILQPPSAAHWAGTDEIGRDVFSRILVAARLDLGIAVTAVCLSFIVGAVAGGLSGYFGGTLDRWTGRLVDVLMAFPLFVLAMAIMAALGNSVANVVYATAIINLPFYIRFARAEVNARRGSAWVEAARMSGNGSARIVLAFLLPNVLPVLAIQLSINLGWAVINAAGLSFIGLGIQPPAPEWGIMVSEGARFLSGGKWWLMLCPGLALMISVLCFNLLGDGLRDLFDPRSRT